MQPSPGNNKPLNVRVRVALLVFALTIVYALFFGTIPGSGEPIPCPPPTEGQYPICQLIPQGGPPPPAKCQREREHAQKHTGGGPGKALSVEYQPFTAIEGAWRANHEKNARSCT